MIATKHRIGNISKNLPSVNTVKMSFRENRFDLFFVIVHDMWGRLLHPPWAGRCPPGHQTIKFPYN